MNRQQVRTGIAAMLAIALVACAVPEGKPLPPTVSRVQMSSPTIEPKGLEAVIGQSAERLQQLFGAPRLDIAEADARKLQFANGQCILDAYLYPQGSGGAQIVTYVDARRGDGQPVDRAACVAALRR
ncbi:MAG: hypothetical protein R3E02_11455 [Blastomonas sp.]